MVNTIYIAGLDFMPKLITDPGDFVWMLFTDAYTPDATHALVGVDLNPGANELGEAGYARNVGVTGEERTIQTDHLRYTHDALVFGTVAPGAPAEWAILAYDPDGDDATAIPVLCGQLDAVARDNLPDLAVSPRGLVHARQAT